MLWRVRGQEEREMSASRIRYIKAAQLSSIFLLTRIILSEFLSQFVFLMMRARNTARDSWAVDDKTHESRLLF